MNYNLNHLTQNIHQDVLGPIQDDEALLLYGFIRTSLARNIVELGCQTGYSAQNFLAAVGPNGIVVSIDRAHIVKLQNNHFTVLKDAKDVTESDLPFEEIHLAFYDCHDYDATLAFHYNMINAKKITNNTTLVLHDTGLHHKQIVNFGEPRKEGWAHQPVERQLSNHLIKDGWSAIHAHGRINSFTDNEPIAFRHGMTILQKNTILDE
jgi:SAM-dependent methyltransferase